MKRGVRTWWALPLSLAAVLAPYASFVRLPADPLGLPVLDGTLFPVVPHLVPGGAVAGLHPGAAARLHLLAPVWSQLTGRPLWTVGVLALALLALAAVLPGRGGGRWLRRGVAAFCWGAALVLVPLWAVTAPWLLRRREAGCTLAGMLLALGFGLAASHQPAPERKETGAGAVAVTGGERTAGGPADRAWLSVHVQRDRSWGRLLDLTPPARAGAVLATVARELPRVRDLRAAATWFLLAGGAADRAAVSLEIWRRTWPEDAEGRLAEGWYLLLAGDPGAALRRFRVQRSTDPAAATAGRILALRALGREGEAADLLTAWSFAVPPPTGEGQAPGR